MSTGEVESAVRAALQELADPETGRPLQAEQVREVRRTEAGLHVRVALPTFAAPLWPELAAECAELVRKALGDAQPVRVEIVPFPRPAPEMGQIGLHAKGVIAVGSGKGGVGKSTIAASLAWGLHRSGCRVGLMDADVYGPSIPHLLGVHQRPEIANNRIQPIDHHGLKVMSMGFLVPPGEAVVWRGPMLHGAITQFLRDTAWGELDYLIIDLPPGTGDIALTLSQLLPLTGAIVVCTPQDVALLDAVKAIAMFRKVNIPVLGMIENMSYFVCPDTGKRYDIFGSGGARRRAAELDIPFLGEVPINIQIRINGDEGDIEGNFRPDAGATYFEEICRTLVRNLARQARAAPPLPKLTVL
jgi:ATP-binding protein involved in chromosome partitioning